MQNIWKKVYDLLHETFPGRPIVNTFGNNDFSKDMIPALTKSHKEEVYGFLAKLWFKDNKFEENLKTLPNFYEGGYYVKDLAEPKGLSVIALNSIYFN